MLKLVMAKARFGVLVEAFVVFVLLELWSCSGLTLTLSNIQLTYCRDAMQVNSEFQAFKHIESLGRGELMRATRPLEVTVAVYPTLVLTNALPYDMDIVVWQVRSCPCTQAVLLRDIESIKPST